MGEVDVVQHPAEIGVAFLRGEFACGERRSFFDPGEICVEFACAEAGAVEALALLRPPLALWGYNVSATEEALGVIARSVTARDVEIATLRRELDELRARWEPEK